MSDARIPERKPGTTPAGTRPGGSGAEDPSTISPSGVFTAPPPTAAAGSPSTISPSGVFTAPPSTVGPAAGGPASSPAARPYERVMEPTPPLPDVRADTDVPRSSPRWQGLAAGIVAAVVLLP